MRKENMFWLGNRWCKKKCDYIFNTKDK